MPSNPNTAHTHTKGVGLVVTGSGGTSGSVEYKAALASETLDANVAVSRPSANANRTYPVIADKNGKLAAIVPWVDSTYHLYQHIFRVYAENTDSVSETATYRERIRFEILESKHSSNLTFEELFDFLKSNGFYTAQANTLLKIDFEKVNSYPAHGVIVNTMSSINLDNLAIMTDMAAVHSTIDSQYDCIALGGYSVGTLTPI